MFHHARCTCPQLNTTSLSCLLAEQGATLSLRVRQDSGQYVFTTAPPQCRPHHALVPRWHYDMVQDTLRNEAYDQAIRWALGM